MRITRRLILAALVAGALFLGANTIAERVAESRLAEEAQKSFGTAARPTVSIEGFPILVNLLRGRIPKASVQGRDLVVEDLTVAAFRITIEGIEASISDLSEGKPIRIDRGLAVADVTSAAVTAYVRDRGHKVSVTVRPGGIVVTGAVPGGTGTAEGTPKLTGRLLTFTPEKVSVDGRPLSGPALEVARRELSFEIDLPELPGGVRVTSIDYGQGVARLVARLEKATIDLSKA